MAQAIHDGRVPADADARPAEALRDVRLSSTVTAVRLLPGGAGVEVEVEGQVRGAAGESSGAAALERGERGRIAMAGCRPGREAARPPSLAQGLRPPLRPTMRPPHPPALQAKPLWAHAVVCTLPLGCLQKGTVRFEPALPGAPPLPLPRWAGPGRRGRMPPAEGRCTPAACPPVMPYSLSLLPRALRCAPPLPAEYKQEAIRRLGMGTEDRVAMLFDEARRCCCCACMHVWQRAPAALPCPPPALRLAWRPLRWAPFPPHSGCPAPLPAPPSVQCFWPAAPHFLRPVSGRYTFANMHALGVTNVLCAWVRPDVSWRGSCGCPRAMLGVAPGAGGAAGARLGRVGGASRAAGGRALARPLLALVPP